MQTIDSICPLQHAFGNHALRSAGANLFRRLEQKPQFSCDLFTAVAVIRSSGEQHGCMPVVAAGMHDPFIL